MLKDMSYMKVFIAIILGFGSPYSSCTVLGTEDENCKAKLTLSH